MGSTDTASTTSASTAGSTGGGGGAPKPMPMAIMRNAHEAIRGAMGDIQGHLDNDDFESAKVLWHKFHRYSDLHMKMEEGRANSAVNSNAKGLFQLVDDNADKAADAAGLRGHHSELYELEEDVVDIFEQAPDIVRAKEIYPLFRQQNESHLKEEEDILMPAIQKMIKSGVPVKKYIQSDIMPVLMAKEGDMEFFIKFSNEMLQNHDNVPGHPRVRVFDHGLWALAGSPEQWKEWDSWIKDTLTDEKYEEVQKAIQAFKAEQKAKGAGGGGGGAGGAGGAGGGAAAAPSKDDAKKEEAGGGEKKKKKKSLFKKIFGKKKEKA